MVHTFSSLSLFLALFLYYLGNSSNLTENKWINDDRHNPTLYTHRRENMCCYCLSINLTDPLLYMYVHGKSTPTHPLIYSIPPIG
jgi:hypothetical protein